MTETSSTTAPTHIRDLVNSLGIGALALHMADNNLPTPLAVDFGDDKPAISVRLRCAEDREQWLASVDVDTVDSSPGTTFLRKTWHVRLPGTGTRIDLVGLEAKPPMAVAR